MSCSTAILLCAALLSATAGQERLRLQYDELAARADALVEVVDQTAANLRRQGRVLHPDIIAARNKVVAAMERASEALDKHEWKLLRTRLARARGYIDLLQRKL